MLFGLFKQNNPGTFFIIFPIISLILWFPSFFHHQVVWIENAMPLYMMVQQINHLPLLADIIMFVLLIGQSMLLKILMDKFEILPFRSNLIALVFFVLNGLCDQMFHLNPIIWANSFLMLACWRLYASNRQSFIASEAFDAGLFIGIASLFHFSYLFFAVFLYVSILLIRPFNARELIIGFLGTLTTYIFCFSFAYFFDYQDVLVYKNLSDSLTPIVFESSFLIQFITPASIFVFALVLISFPAFLRYVSFAILRLKNTLLSAASIALYGILSILFDINTSPASLVVFSIPFSIIITIYLLKLKKTWIAELLLFALLGLMFYQAFAAI